MSGHLSSIRSRRYCGHRRSGERTLAQRGTCSTRVMSDTSELGPIDPQIVLADSNGNHILHPIQRYLDAYDEHTETLKNEPGNASAQIMLNKLDPATVKLFQATKARARKFADEQLDDHHDQSHRPVAATSSVARDREVFPLLLTVT